jgi:F0F1-type ATP synthase assembly protein I
MNGRTIMFGIVTLLGGIMVFLNIWLFMLNGESRPLLMAGLGVLFVIAGLLNIRRERIRMREQLPSDREG